MESENAEAGTPNAGPQASRASPAAWQTSQGGPQASGYPAGDEIKTLWIGDLQYWMDEAYLQSCFAFAGGVQSCKVIRNKLTGATEGYGFIEFATHQSAESALSQCTGALMPNTQQAFRLNWASVGRGGGHDGQSSAEHSIFVGDIAPEITDTYLLQIFKSLYPSARGAKVVTDANGRSKCYGFVRFADEKEKTRAMAEMQGYLLQGRPMRISSATPKKPGAPSVPSHQEGAYGGEDPNNTTVFVGGLDPAVSEEELRNIFGQFGDLVYVKIPVNKGCGFVQFVHRAHADEALQKLHGTMIGTQPVRLTWGRSPAAKRGTTQPSVGSYPAYTTAADPWAAYYQSYDPTYTAWAAQPVDPYAGYAYGWQQAQYPQGYDGQYAQVGGDAGVQYQFPPQQAEQAQGQQEAQPVKEEPEDPLALPDVDKLNAQYMAKHQSAFQGRHQSLHSAQQTPGQPVSRVL